MSKQTSLTRWFGKVQTNTAAGAEGALPAPCGEPAAAQRAVTAKGAAATKMSGSGKPADGAGLAGGDTRPKGSRASASATKGPAAKPEPPSARARTASSAPAQASAVRTQLEGTPPAAPAPGRGCAPQASTTGMQAEETPPAAPEPSRVPTQGSKFGEASGAPQRCLALQRVEAAPPRAPAFRPEQPEPEPPTGEPSQPQAGPSQPDAQPAAAARSPVGSAAEGSHALRVPAAAPPAILSADGLSEYERQRLLNIARNNQVLASLGLLEPGLLVDGPTNATVRSRPLKPKPAKRARDPAPPAFAVRRSTRATDRGAEAASGSGGAAQEEEENESEEAAEFESSAVLRYVLGGGERARSDAPARAGGADAGLVSGFRRSAGLADCVSAAMARVYAIDLAPVGPEGAGWLVAAAGEKGVVEVYGLRAREGAGGKEEVEEALLSFEAHRGWVGSVQLLAAQAGADEGADDGLLGGWLLSAANDGVLKLWDLRAAARTGKRAGTPKLLASEASMHSGKGIFSMHERGGSVLTASKDGSVGLTVIALSELRAERTWEGVCDGGVVKAVAWSGEGGLGPSTFAAGGRGGVVALLDARDSAGRPSLCIQGAHPRDVHCVRWQPAAAEAASPLLLTASYDPVIRLWDPRRLAEPAAQLKGHVAPRLAKQNKIHQPCFCAGGAAVVASGEGSEALSLYCTRTGAPISRGLVGWEPSTLAVASGASGCLAVAHGRTISVLEPLTQR